MEENDINASADYTNFSLVSGGLIYRIMTLNKKNKDPNTGLKRRTIVFTLIAWLPLLLLVLIDAVMAGSRTEFTLFIKDFDIQLRILFVIPFLIFIERSINNSFVTYIKTSDDLIENAQQSRFDKLVNSLDRLSNLYLPEIIILIIIYGLLIFRFNSGFLEEYERSYILNPESKTLTLAGYYFFFVSFPLFQLLLFRWVWRWIIWVYSVFSLSRFTFNIEAVNIDKMAGLIYLNNVPLYFTFIFFSISVMISSSFGYNILYEGQNLKNYFLDIIFFVSMVPVMVYFPLLLFIPNLLKAKSAGINKMGKLVAQHNSEYMEKWTSATLPKGEELVGSVDHSSLSDINGGYGPVIDMDIIPISRKNFFLSVILLLIPFIPLIFTYYSAIDLFNLILGAAFDQTLNLK